MPYDCLLDHVQIDYLRLTRNWTEMGGANHSQ